jgi:hypothetical protein
VAVRARPKPGSAPRRRGSGAVLLALLALPACHPVVVRGGETAAAEIRVPPRPEPELNILAIGRADAEGRIVLRATGIDVARGETAMIGMMGPGLVPGTSFVVLGTGFRASVVRYGETQGGSGAPMPAAVVSLVVPQGAPPGLYSVIAVRGVEMAMLSGGIEVL